MLETLGQVDLDKLDNIVFNSCKSQESRQQALAFMMDHTLGFDEESTKATDAHVTQCEILLEFAEYHLRCVKPESGKLLAHACLSLPCAGLCY